MPLHRRQPQRGDIWVNRQMAAAHCTIVARGESEVVVTSTSTLIGDGLKRFPLDLFLREYRLLTRPKD